MFSSPVHVGDAVREAEAAGAGGQCGISRASLTGRVVVEAVWFGGVVVAGGSQRSPDSVLQLHKDSI